MIWKSIDNIDCPRCANRFHSASNITHLFHNDTVVPKEYFNEARTSCLTEIINEVI